VCYMYGFRFFILLLICPLFAHADVKFQFFTIGTGGVTGVYYSAGNAICRLVNKNFVEYKMRCAVESTAGSDFNVRSVRDKDFVFGLVQAGIHYKAYNGVEGFSNHKPYKSLRSLFSLHDEVFTVMARNDKDIHTLDDLKNNIVNGGDEGSGTRIGAIQLMGFAGFSEAQLSELTYFKPDQTTAALCSDKIAAYIYMVGHPARNIRESTEGCDAKILAVTGSAAKGLDNVPYYSKYTIGGGMYKNNPNDIETYSVKATLITDKGTPDIVAYNLVKSVIENIEDFKEMHPAFSTLSIKKMVSEGLSAPLHNGAKKYYKERGFL
jgi:TRAP transporter TAXI family solute receptor